MPFRKQSTIYDGTSQRHFIRIFQLIPDRDTTRYHTQLHVHAVQLARDIEIRRVPSIVELKARITSFTSPPFTRSTRLSICRSEGPMPSMGEMTPQDMVQPLYCCVASTAITSRILSTTQIVEASAPDWNRYGKFPCPIYYGTLYNISLHVSR